MKWWLLVTVIPEEIKIIVLIKGTSKGFNGIIPAGGHWWPTSKAGARLLWKKAQKKETKKNTSEMINKIIPQRNPSSTIFVCKPWKADSLATSFHHWNIIKIIKIRAVIIKKGSAKKNNFKKPKVRIKDLRDLRIGQGDSFTRW